MDSAAGFRSTLGLMPQASRKAQARTTVSKIRQRTAVIRFGSLTGCAASMNPSNIAAFKGSGE